MYLQNNDQVGWVGWLVALRSVCRAMANIVQEMLFII
jgi:hypothetical protein